MKIVHVNTFHLSGGAARAAFQLHKSLLGIGADSWLFCRAVNEQTPNTYGFSLPQSPRAQLEMALRQEQLQMLRQVNLQNVSADCEVFSSEWDLVGADLCEQFSDADIINLHWVAFFIDIPVLMKFSRDRGIPIVWTLHDMNPFTGGCHYSGDCRKFETQCGNCPQLNSHIIEDWSSSIQNAKISAYQELSAHDLTIVTPSHWLADEVRSSRAMGHLDTYVLPNSIDETVYKPHEKQWAREVAGLPKDAGILLFIAQFVANPRKGMDVLQEALMHHVKNPNLHLIIIGATEDEQGYPFPCTFFGAISDDNLASVAFSAADAIVLPSRQDNLPNTMVEALACGTAVIGSDVGGIPDLVIPGHTGFLFANGDAQSLGETIDKAFSDLGRLREYGKNGRLLAEKKLTCEVQAQAYKSLYEDILSKRRAR